MNCIWCKKNKRKRYTQVCSDRCLVLHSIEKKGYCWLTDKKIIKKTTARRFVFETFLGPIRPKHLIINTCKRKKCVNPKHLIDVDNKSLMFEKRLNVHKECNKIGLLSLFSNWLKKKFYGVRNGLYSKYPASN